MKYGIYHYLFSPIGISSIIKHLLNAWLCEERMELVGGEVLLASPSRSTDIRRGKKSGSCGRPRTRCTPLQPGMTLSDLWHQQPRLPKEPSISFSCQRRKCYSRNSHEMAGKPFPPDLCPLALLSLYYLFLCRLVYLLNKQSLTMTGSVLVMDTQR